jgi:flagellar biosynthesis protein FlhG
MSAPPRIWAIGGGKGGVGKSVVTANLAVALARSGKECVILDADLGGANLHTLFGLSSPNLSLNDLLNRRVGRLDQLSIPTGVPNLRLISGVTSRTDLANLPHAQKVKIIRQLRSLRTDYLLLDLGAGSTYNVLDFFLAADERLLVVTPQPTAVENAYLLLKAAFARHLKQTVARLGAAALLDDAVRNRAQLGIRTPAALLAHLSGLDPHTGEAVTREMLSFMPRIVVNQVRREDELDLGEQMALAASDYFGTRIGCIGALHNDEEVHRAVQMKRPVLEHSPQGRFSQGVNGLTRSLLDAEETRS